MSVRHEQAAVDEQRGGRVARGGRVHGVGLGTLRACGASVTLRSRQKLEISKSAQVVLDFQGPVVTLKIEAVVHEMVVASASSMTEGGVVGNVNAAVSVVPSVILDLIVLRNRFLGPRRGGERLRGARWARSQLCHSTCVARS